MKEKITALLLTTTFCLCMVLTCPSANAVDPGALPVLDNSVNGNVTTVGSNMNVVTQGGAGAVGQFDWSSFNVGSNASVNWAFTAHSQTALNRVLGNNMSQIYGKLTSSCAVAGCSYGDTGKVILINPNGLMFGSGSQVNLNSFTASTFDAVGAKNIKDMSSSELATYKSGLTSKFGPTAKISYLGSASKPGAAITLDNSTWNIDKSAAIVAKDINLYKGSKLSTNLAYNYGPDKNFSNVKLVTSNGVDFEYQANGYIKNDTVKVADGLSGVDYNITIGDKNSSNATDATINSGSVLIQNGGKTANSDININKSVIKGYKLVNNAYGDIYIVGNNKVAIDDSLLETHNTYDVADASKNTYSKIGGNITIKGAKGVDIKNSTLRTAYSTSAAQSGDVIVQAGTSGNVNVKESTINSKGGIYLRAENGTANVENSVVSARNLDSTGNYENLLVYGTNGVNVTNSNLDASDIAQVQSTNGNVNLIDNGKIYAGSNLNIYGKNSLIDGSALSYNNLNLHDGTNTNNITIQDTTTFQDRDSTNGLVLDVKGNLVINNNQLKTRTPGEYVGNVANAPNQTKITLNATGNISIQGGSDITSAGDITATTPGGSISVNNSKLTSVSNNIALNGKNTVGVTNSSALKAGKAINLISSSSNVNVYNSSLEATGSNNITAQTDANFSKATLKDASNVINAKTGNVSITDSDFTSGKNMSIVATLGKTNTLTSTLKSNEGNIVMQGKSGVDIETSSLAAVNNQISSSNGGINVINRSKLVADKTNTMEAKTVNVECSSAEGENNIAKATTGAVTIKNSIFDAKQANNINAKTDVSLTNAIAKGTNNLIKAPNKITLTNAQVIASNKNTLDAKNITTKYDVNLAQECAESGCMNPVAETKIQGNINDIIGGAINLTDTIIDGVDNAITATEGDVILDGVTLTPGTTKPEDSTTVITAAGNVATGARVVYDDLYDKTGTIIGTGSLNTGGTKVYINSDKDLNLVLEGTNNQKAGIELSGQKIEMIAKDGELSISRIYANDLYIHEGNKFIAGEVTLTDAEKANRDTFAPSNPVDLQNKAGADAELPGRAYIQVEYGFNFDYDPSMVAVGGIYQGSFGEIRDAAGNVIGYGTHYINLDNTSTAGQFVLAYEKPFACDPLPDVPVETPDYGYLSDETALTQIPMQATMPGQAGPIANNMTDPSLGVIAAAAGIVLDDEEQLDY